MLQLVIALCIIALVCVSGKPYQVPMMGNAAGKRTLILVDDMVSSFPYTNHFAHTYN
jgi:hypothetical protein